MASKNKKVIIIGLDGLGWSLVDKLISNGVMPNIERLKKEGVHGPLKSTYPPVTAPAWVSFATGQNPGKHGCFDFVVPYKNIDNYRPVSSKSIKAETFYELLSSLGKESIVINLPVTFPPKIEKTLVTSLLTRGDNFVFPKELKDEIPEFKNYKLAPEGKKERDEKSHIQDILSIEKVRFECAKKLFLNKPWDLFFILFSGTDWIQHSKHNDLINKDLGENQEALKIFKEIDEYVGWFVRNLPDDTNLLIMSDHGFTDQKGVFFINQWLAKEKYLKIETKSKKHVDFGKISESRDKSASKGLNLQLSGVTSFLWKHPALFKWAKKIYDKLKKFLPIYVQQDYGINPANTKAHALSHLIYLNRHDKFKNGIIKDKEVYAKTKEEIINKLKGLEDSEKNKIFDQVIDASDVYSGDQIKNGPDIILYSEKYLIKSIHGPIMIKGNYQYHSLYGVFMAFGPEIEKNKKINGKNIIDIMPTFLKLLDLDPPPNLDGKVIEEILKNK